MDRDVMREVHHHYFHDVDMSPVINRLDSIIMSLNRIEKREVNFMATIREQVAAILAGVTAEHGQAESIAKLLADYNKALLDALASVNIPPEVQADLDAIMSGVTSNTKVVVDAINANPLPGVPPIPPPA